MLELDLGALANEAAVFLRGLLPPLAALPATAGRRPRLHALACEFVIGHGGSDAERAGGLRVYIATSQEQVRDAHVEEWGLARWEDRVCAAQPPFFARTHQVVRGSLEKPGEAAARDGEPYPLEGILDALGRALLEVTADDALQRHGFVARPVLSAFTMEELEWNEGPYSVPTERMRRLRRAR